MKFNGILLQTIRKNYGLSRQDLADILPDITSRRSVDRWENGETPRLDVIACIVNVFPELRSSFVKKRFDLLCYDETLEKKIEQARKNFAEKVG